MDQEIRKIIKEQVHILYEGDKIKSQIDEQYEMLYEFLGFGKKKQPIEKEHLKKLVSKLQREIDYYKDAYKELTGTRYEDMDAQKKILKMLENPSGTPYEEYPDHVKEYILTIIQKMPQTMRHYANLSNELQMKHGESIHYKEDKPPEPVSI